jgi:hypothetical protein
MLSEGKLGERFRMWLWGHPERRNQAEVDQERRFLHHLNQVRCRASMHGRRRAKNRVRNRMQKLSRRINWGLA